MLTLIICIAAVVLDLAQHTVEAQEATCGLVYQDILKETINLKKRCDNAAYRDCCQVIFTIIFMRLHAV